MSSLLASISLAALLIGLGSGAWLFTANYRMKLRKLVIQLHHAIPISRRPLPTGSLIQQLHQVVAESEIILNELDHRVPHRHPVTGLRTREFLLSEIEQSSNGILGVIEMSDFDALYARDAVSAEVAIKEFASRAMRITAAGRTLAQIDRARLGIWVPQIDDNDTQAELHALWYALGERIELEGLDLLPKIKAGYALRTSAEENGSALLARAVANLSDDTATARGTSAGDMPSKTDDHVLLVLDLRQAVARHEFQLQYQPFVDAEKGTVCGAEALIRWHHPQHGLVSPSIFVPLVEKNGLSEEVGLWVLDSAIADAASWQRSLPLDVKIAVNLSAHQLMRSDLDVVIGRMLLRHHLSSSLLELELTETVAAMDSISASALFDKLRKQNIAISIDDFGAGYSSLSYLKRMKFDKLKIDREFVTNVDTDRRSQAICQSIIALGRGLGITVLAEGVEQAGEYLWLRRHGCRYFQGYYFSKPVDLDDFVAFARDTSGLADRVDYSATGLHNKLVSAAG